MAYMKDSTGRRLDGFAAVGRSEADSLYRLKGADSRKQKYQARLANRYTTPANILCIGDSFTEGTGATVLARRWLNLVQTQLRARYQPAGVTGAALCYIPAFPGAGGTITDWPVTRTGNITKVTWGGLGLHLASFNADGTGVLTFTFTGTSAKLLYPKGTFGKMSVVVDGGAATVIDQFSGTVGGGFAYNITGLSAGAHTVVVTRDATSVAGRTIAIEGLVVWNGDEAAGVRVIEAAHHGTAINQYSDSFNLNFWPGSIAALGTLAAIVIGLGYNDATAADSVATMKTNMQALITKLRSAPTNFAGTIFVVYWPLRTGTDATKWTQWGTALEEIEAADANVKLIRIRGAIPDEGTGYTDASNLGLYESTNHFNDAGNVFTSDIFVSELTF